VSISLSAPFFRPLCHLYFPLRSHSIALKSTQKREDHPPADRKHCLLYRISIRSRHFRAVFIGLPSCQAFLVSLRRYSAPFYRGTDLRLSLRERTPAKYP